MRWLRRRSERGAALVEAAIVFIPLCVVLFGIIEYGFIFKDSLTLSSATRAGARTASAEPQASTFLSDTVAAVTRAATAAKFKNGDTLWIYEADTDGTSKGAGDPCSVDCVRYTWNGSAFASPVGSWPAGNQAACLGVAGGMDSVGVKLRLSHDAITGFFQDMTLTERTIMRLEPLTNCA